MTPIVDDELSPLPLVIDFRVEIDPKGPPLDVSESVAAIDRVGTVLETGVTLEPALPGQWRWADENSLQFQPERDWPAGETYRVRFDPSLFTPNLALASTQAEFTSLAFSATLEALEFYQDPTEQSERKVVATLAFSHPVDAQSLEDALTFAMKAAGATVAEPSQPVARAITLDAHGRKAFVHSTPIELPSQEAYLTLELARGLAPLDGPSRFDAQLTDRVLIPDVGSYFRVGNVQSLLTRNDEDEPQQTLTFEFTDRVSRLALEQKLTAYLLPTAATINGTWTDPVRWRAAREVTPAVLAQAERLELTLNPVQGGRAQAHTAFIDVPERRAVYVHVDSGLTSEGGFELSLPSAHLVTAPGYPKEAKIAQSGALLPLTSSRRLTLLARGVQTLRVDVGRLLDGQINHLASQTRGDIKSPYFASYDFNEDNITERTTQFIDLNAAHPKQAVYASHRSGRRGRRYPRRLLFRDRSGMGPSAQLRGGQRGQRFVLITDLGLLAKTNTDLSQAVFVHSIATGAPVEQAQVALLGKNGVPILERVTDKDGHAALPTARAFEREQTPTVFVVRKGADATFLPYRRGGRMLQYSRFDVGGDYANPNAQGGQVRAQVFSDRGLYRPGDTVTLAAIVKRDDWASLGRLPLALRVLDPRGQVVLDKRLRLPEDGFFDATLVTQPASPTGSYSATVYLIEDERRRRVIGSTTLRVETFQPDRLRIQAAIAGQKAKGWLRPAALTCEVTLANLFGTPAQDRRVRGELTLRPMGIRFSDYPDFVFDDPLREPV